MLSNRNTRGSVVSKLAAMVKVLDYRRPNIDSPAAVAPTLGVDPADYPIEDYRSGFRSGLEAGIRLWMFPGSRSHFRRGFRNGLEAGMAIGRSDGRGYAQVAVQQAIEARIRAAENRGDAEAARVLRNLAAQLPDPRRSLRAVS